MTLVPLPVAKMHIRAEDAADDEVTPYLSAAELAAASFLNRQVYATQGELDAAVAGVPVMLTAAGVAHTAAVEAAEALEDAIARAAGVAYADTVYARAQDEAREIRAGATVKGCTADPEALAGLAAQQDAIRSALPASPNERLVYRCQPAAASAAVVKPAAAP